MTKLASLAAVCTLALAGGAYAADPIALTGAQMDGVTAGVDLSNSVSFSERKDIKVNVYKSYAANVKLHGTSAQATAAAVAQSDNGEDVLAETAFVAYTYSGPFTNYAESGGTAISAIDTK